MRIKIVFLSLIFSLSLYSYILPYFQQQNIYFKETLKSKSYGSFKFKIEDKEYIAGKAGLKSDNPLLYILSELFTNHKSSLLYFAKNHKLDKARFHYELYNDTPVVVYGSIQKTSVFDTDKLKSEIWLDNEKAFPVKAVFKFNDKLIIAEFVEYANQKYKYLFPSKVILTVNGEKKVYYISFL